MARTIHSPGRLAILLLAAIFSGIIGVGSLTAQADFLTYNFTLNPTYTETIDATNRTIRVEVYNSADVTKLVSVFTTSANAVVRIGSVVQYSGISMNDFSSPVVYSVTSGDGSVTRDWTVTVVRREASVEKQLLTFSFASIGANATVNQTDHTVYITVPYSQDVTAMVATFQISPLASLRIGTKVMVSGVTAHDYTQALEENANTITLTVVAENGSTRNYYISVRRAAAQTGKDITYFAFEALDPDVVGVIDQTAKTITLTVPYETPVTSLVATFTKSYLSTVKVGNTNQVSGVTQNNFTNPVTYTVVAEDGSTKAYVVTVNKAAASTAKSILTFKFAGVSPEIVAAIDQTNHTITANVPYAVDVTTLVATFTASTFANVSVNNVTQVSGQTPNDFTDPVVYKVTAQDGSTQNYTVTITRAAASQENQLLTFKFEAGLNSALTATVNGTIDHNAKTVTVTVPYATNVTALIATFTHSALSTVTVNDVVQVSGVNVHNFTTVVNYKVTAEDGSSEIYRVTVNKSPASQENTLISFRFPTSKNASLPSDAIGVVDQAAKSVIVHVPYGTNVTTLIASFVLSDFATAKIGTVTQQSGVTPNDFTNVVTYSIYAQDQSVELYTVTVIVDLNAEKRILTFSFQGISPPTSGTVDESTKTVLVQIPNAVAKTSLVATFTLSDHATAAIGGVAQVSGTTANDFTNPVVYTITAQDGSTQTYQVTVNNLPIQTGKQITEFKFTSFDPVIVASINQSNRSIKATVPFGTDRTAMVATFSHSYLSTVKVGTVTQISGVTANNFSNLVTYRVTAEDGSFQDYVVTVLVDAPSTEKQLLYFAFQDFDPDVTGTIDQTNFTVNCVVPYGTDRSALVASFTVSEHAQVKVTGMDYQQSGITINDFRAPLVYEVYAQDGSMQDYLVTVSEEPDVTAPVVTVNAQAVTNSLGQFVLLRSNEATGKVYIIHSDAAQSTVAELEAAVAAGRGKSALVQTANVDIPVSTYALPEGTYHAYAVDASQNMSARGTNDVTVTDDLAPVVYINYTSISNAPNKYVVAQSSEGNSYIYLIKEGVPQTTEAELNNAINSRNGAKAFAVNAYANVNLSVTGLNPGNYRAYAIDQNDNMSGASAQMVVIIAASRLKEFTSFSFQGTNPVSVGTISGNAISIEVPHRTAVESLVATFTLSQKAKAYIGLVEQVSGVTSNDYTTALKYRVEAEDGSTKDFTVTVTVNDGTGIETWDLEHSFVAYPVPVTDVLNIELHSPIDEVVVTNLTGQTVFVNKEIRSDLLQIQVSDWDSGVYLIQFIKNNQLVHYKKIIRQ